MQRDETPILNMVFFGGEKTGKTSVLNRLVEGSYTDSNIATIGIDFKILYPATANRGNQHNRTDHNFQIWDTAGQERFDFITEPYYRRADVLVGFFDLTNPASIDRLVAMAKQAAIKKGLPNPQLKVPLILVGTKLDDLKVGAPSEEVTERVRQAVADLENMGFELIRHEDQILDYIDISAKDGTHIEDRFVPTLNAAAKLAIAQKAQPSQPTLAQQKNEEEKIPGFFERNPNAELYIKRGLVVLGVLAFVAAIVVGGILSGGALYALGAGAGIGIFAAAAHSAICVAAVALLGSYGAAVLGVLGVVGGVMGTIFSAYKAKDFFYTQTAGSRGPKLRYQPPAAPNPMVFYQPTQAELNNTAVARWIAKGSGNDNENPESKAVEVESPNPENSKKAKHNVGLFGWLRQHIGSSEEKPSKNQQSPRPGSGSDEE